MSNQLVQVGTRWVSACSVLAIVPAGGQVNVTLDGMSGYVAMAATNPEQAAADLAAHINSILAS